MPSYYIYPTCENRNDTDLFEFSLSENFYGLMVGVPAYFEEYPLVFEQILHIAGVNFDAIQPFCISGHYPGDKKYENVQQDIFMVQQKMMDLHENLMLLPHFYDLIIFPDDWSDCQKKYFADFANVHYIIKDKQEWLEATHWALDEGEFYGTDNTTPSFGEEIRFILRFIELAIQKGNKKCWLQAR